MPTSVTRVFFLASLLLVASAQGSNTPTVGARLQGARPQVVIGTRSAEPRGRQKNGQQDQTVVAAIASAQVSATSHDVRLAEPVAVGSDAGASATFGGTGVITAPIEAFPTETRQAPIDVSKKLNTAIRNSDIAGAVEIMTREDDVHELARGLKFDGSERSTLLKKSASRMPDGDVITMKSIAKAVLDTKDARKFAMVMALSTLNERREDLERKLVQVLRDRELMHAILFADPARQFIPDEVRVLSSSPRIRQSEKDGSTNGRNGRRRLTCQGCSPENSFVCVHCWPKDICQLFSFCP
ncbi:hypothetical protein BSKO_05959 [Bryopsis sp. KO-2023]|nr:hypothetical protein BSKO_05959 [Bryopsis sp. KO-2023]